MALQDIFFSTMAGAAIVLMGALYALFYALAKMNNHRLAWVASAVSYLGLVAATLVLIDALHLRGFWLFVSAVMVLGYLLAPQAIWQLCVSLHSVEDTQRANKSSSVDSILARAK